MNLIWAICLAALTAALLPACQTREERFAAQVRAAQADPAVQAQIAKGIAAAHQAQAELAARQAGR